MHRGIKWPRDVGRGRTGRTLNSHSDKHSLVHKHKLVSTRAHTHTHTHTHVTEGNSPTTRNARHARHIYKGTGGRCFPVGSHPPPSDSQSAIRWHSLVPVSAHMSTATFLNSSTRKTVRITSCRMLRELWALTGCGGQARSRTTSATASAQSCYQSTSRSEPADSKNDGAAQH